ncbi:uncharacterized protein Triagg1_7992 [Trichoderma aggressivum f. europaeum]|uniref:Enoyl-CoA hydratase n=1 Tax=Trichoderma aggressivum f. europaeum TaxID=173218 RepID=A0AAE1I8Z6_9HYPO|nr:hypothetical protein Triagg1_7992 [Trichoderma aggressivum f. europaeum]
MSSTEAIIVNKITPAYWCATFNNGTLNLFGPEGHIALKKLIKDLESDKSVRVIVFDSSSPDFSSACDLRFASRERAVFCQPEVGAGIIPGGGAFELLPRRVGRARALEILLSSDDYDATTAELYGWIDRAVLDAEFDDFVDKFARRIASFDAQLLIETKRVVDSRWGMPSQVDFAAGMALFGESTKWPSAARMKALFDKGLQSDEEVERNLGAVLETVTERDLSKYRE